MAYAVSLSYYGTNTANYRVLASAAGPRFAYLAIQPGTRLLGVSIGGGFQATAYAVPNDTWVAFGANIENGKITVFADGVERGQFTRSINYELYPPDRVGNLAGPNSFAITAGLAPATTLAPSTSLAPATNTYSAQAVCAGTIDEVTKWDRTLCCGEFKAISVTLYEALPEKPLESGYAETRPNGTVSFAVDAGAAKRRQRFTSVKKRYACSFALTNVQAQELDDFYYSIASQGVAPFNWVDPRTGASIEARFVAPPKHTPNGQEFVASCEFEEV